MARLYILLRMGTESFSCLFRNVVPSLTSERTLSKMTSRTQQGITTCTSMAATKVFVDSSYILALELVHDQDHQAASRHWNGTIKSPPRFVTTSFVFDEVVTFFNSRGYHAKALEVGANLLSGALGEASAQFIQVDDTLFLAGWAYFQRHADKDYSLTDCISFIVMRNLGVTTAFTFDHHFEQAGFLLEPR